MSNLIQYPNIQQGETWRPIPGFEGYEVSDLGRVRSYRRRGGRGRGSVSTPRLKKTHLSSTGYLRVTLQNASEQGCGAYAVHALVAAAFLGPRPDGMEVAHGDGDRTNSRLDNLRYATPLENAADKKLHGNAQIGEKNPRHKLTEDDVRTIRRLREHGSLQRELAARFGVSISAIQFVLNGRNWSHVGGEAA